MDAMDWGEKVYGCIFILYILVFRLNNSFLYCYLLLSCFFSVAGNPCHWWGRWIGSSLVTLPFKKPQSYIRCKEARSFHGEELLSEEAASAWGR